MNPLLIRDAFADMKASAQASNEAPRVNAETVRTTQHYINLANTSVAESSGGAVAIRTMTLQEFRALKRKKE